MVFISFENAYIEYGAGDSLIRAPNDANIGELIYDQFEHGRSIKGCGVK
ncbi:hypothetical protein JK636_20245 [Clostridium sp. YIM B02515]|uniref:Uncharacterized protein n=1 Tax=Clostridium rhizosphaerae TaxID=2803861 RepID=A0ABS1THE8_9CLOT|nr:hypothetical protein [Clostridium rhizosphaerae]MBL4938046.1 hypothetical protein [Clostridium rhizosphaerae]